MEKIHTKDNLADIMTKPIIANKFAWCQSSFGLLETYARETDKIEKYLKAHKSSFKWEIVKSYNHVLWQESKKKNG